MTKKERRRKSDANKLHILNIINKLFWLISLIYIVAQTYMLFAIGLATSVKFVLPPEEVPKPPLVYVIIVIVLMLLIIFACIVKLHKLSAKWKEKCHGLKYDLRLILLILRFTIIIGIPYAVYYYC